MEQPFISDSQNLPELTFKVFVLSIVLAVVLAAANAYLALKIGILISASIPAAIVSMGVLKFFKQSNILENNLVQTCASTGEAVAGGVVYTIPALIIIHYWTSFNYWQSVIVSFLGGMREQGLLEVTFRLFLLNWHPSPNQALLFLFNGMLLGLTNETII